MNTAIVAFGVMSTALSVYLGFKFWRIQNELAKPVAFMAWGGALAGASTLVFSFISLFGMDAALREEVMVLLRFLIFTGITGADIYMFYVLWRVQSDG